MSQIWHGKIGFNLRVKVFSSESCESNEDDEDDDEREDGEEGEEMLFTSLVLNFPFALLTEAFAVGRLLLRVNI